MGQTPNKPQIKLSAEEQQKLAAIDRFDREQAFELGFGKYAKDMGLDESEFKQFYEVGCQKLASMQQPEQG